MEKDGGPRTAARRLARRFGFSAGPFALIRDGAYAGLEKAMEEEGLSFRSLRLSGTDPEEIPAFLRETGDDPVLLLAEPRTWAEQGLYRHADFGAGEPRIPGRRSRVLVFPRESLYRILSADPEDDAGSRDALLSSLVPGGKYLLTSPSGTRLTFTAREWIPLDLEVCTAPVEGSVTGTVAVDGAVFFRACDAAAGEKILLEIRESRLAGISAAGPAGERLAAEYAGMCAPALKDPANGILAEIGIGFCAGARVSDCFMEAEAASGTCHFCFGNNVCYGGANASAFHGDSVLVRDPVLRALP